MRRVCVAVAVVVLSVAGCSGGGAQQPAAPATQAASRGEVLREALRDPQNVDVDAWASASVQDVDGAARSVCLDLEATGVPLATVWQHVIDRFGVSLSDADYFTKASAKVYCPRQERAAGAL